VNNRNKILYFIVPNGEGSILNVSVSSRNSESLKNFYETLEKESSKEIEGEITYGSSYSTLKVFLQEGIEKYKDLFDSFVNSIKK
jgi:hypothetical protein